MIKIALDVMAGDKGIDANIDGALSSLDGSFMVSLVGDQNLIRDKIMDSGRLVYLNGKFVNEKGLKIANLGFFSNNDKYLRTELYSKVILIG